MFEWLLDEVKRVRSRKFFLTDGPMSEEARISMEDSGVPIPPSYKTFVLRFGNAQLYRQSGTYLVRVFAAPREDISPKGEALLHFGRTDVSLAYFKRELLIPGRESPVFVWRHGRGFRKEAESFDEWLLKSCRAAKRRFKRKAWEAIKRGPLPFNEQEKAVVEARKKYSWQTIGVADNKDVLFEVHNGSEMTLPYLSIGIRQKNGERIGGVWVPVDHIRPGETQVVQKGCYKERYAPEEIEPIAKPDPDPEDRDIYWEFKAIHPAN
jgi:hypothetical protein